MQTIYTDPGAVRVESKLVLRSIETLPEFKDLFVGRRRPPWAMILSSLLGGISNVRSTQFELLANAILVRAVLLAASLPNAM